MLFDPGLTDADGIGFGRPWGTGKTIDCAGPAGPEAAGAGALLAGTTIVDVLDLVMVDTVVVTCSISFVPDVTVLVTGHVVKVVYSLRSFSR